MSRTYDPGRAWVLGAVYVAACILISWLLGVPTRLIGEPLFLPAQARSTVWIVWTALATAYTVFGYLFFWPRGTTAHGRPAHIAAIVFGVCWGLAQGLLVLAVFELVHGFVGNRWISAACTMVLWSVFIGLWQSRFWDVYVSPDHNIREWNVRKVLVVHVPFLVLTLSHYAAYGNTAIFLGWWMLALTASAWVMRFPAPWDAPVPAHDGRGVAESEVRQERSA